MPLLYGKECLQNPTEQIEIDRKLLSILCYGFNCVLHKDMLKSQLLVPMKVTLFGTRVFAHVTKLG